MTKFALVATALVLGSSSLALADNVVVAQAAPAAPVTVQAPLAAQAPVAVQAPVIVAGPGLMRPWQLLSAGDKIAPNGRDTIKLGITRPLRAIELQATSGRTNVREVAIRFANGRTQIAYENAKLVRGGGLKIDIAGRAKDITSIRVFGASSPRGTFEILGA